MANNNYKVPTSIIPPDIYIPPANSQLLTAQEQMDALKAWNEERIAKANTK
jgi:hypothetical protein